jgi:predicted nucleic acid-binding protein
MSGVLLDTAGLIAVVDAADHWHALAEKIWQGLISSDTSLLTTSLVLIEMADGLSRIKHRRAATELRDRLLSSTRIEIVQTTPDHEARAWNLFGQRIDKEWGMTDCVSIIVAQDREVKDVFSADHHFEQAGFRILLKGG